MASILPLTLLANSVRLLLILEAGAHYSAELAQWVHDHEAPVLIFFCSLGLMGLRHAILSWGAAHERAAGGASRKPESLANDSAILAESLNPFIGGERIGVEGSDFIASGDSVMILPGRAEDSRGKPAAQERTAENAAKEDAVEATPISAS
jgi:hypothetical protein